MVAIITSFDFTCTSNEETDFVVSSLQKRFCEGCVRHFCEKMTAFFNFVIFNSN